MKPSAALVFLVAGLVVGLISGYVMGRSSAAPPAGSPSRGAEAVPDKSAGDAPTPPPPEAPESLSEVLSRIRTERVPEGTGRISGHVATPDGKPLPGVIIKAVPYPARGPAGETVEEKVIDTVSRHRLEEQGSRSVLTAADGAYSIDGLCPDLDYYVSGVNRGYWISSGNSGLVRPDGEVNLTAMARIEVRVCVLGYDGEEVYDVEVHYRHPGQQGGGTHHGGGPLQMQPGTWEIYAVAKNGGLVSEAVLVELPEPGDEEDVTLNLRSRPGVRGRVRFEDNLISGSVQVKLLHLAEGSAPDPERLVREGEMKYLSGHAGLAYSFPNIAPGTYLLGVLVNRKVAAHLLVRVGDEMVESDLIVAAPAADEFLIATVLGPDGEALEGLRFSARSRGKHGSGMSSTDAIRLPSGGWRILLDEFEVREGQEDRRHFLGVVSEKFGESEVEVELGKTREVTVRFTTPGSLEVTVTDYVGSGHEGKVGLQLARAEEGPSPSGPSGGNLDARGCARFGPVAPGTWELRLTSRIGDHDQPVVASRELQIQAGENTETIALPPLYTLTVKVAEGTIRLSSRELELRVFPQRPRDGRVVFSGLPAGAYQLGGRGAGTMEVQVPAQTEVVFAPKEPNALRVDIRKADGLIAKAGFRDGDLIIGVNGEEFTGLADLRSRLMAPPQPGGSNTLLVLRGTARLEITADLSAMGEGADAGARLEPVAR